MDCVQRVSIVFTGLILMFFSANACASVKSSANQRYFELGAAKTRALGTDAYMPNVTVGGFRYENRMPFQITLGFLNKDVSRLKDGKVQELNDFFYLGPQYTGKYRLSSGLNFEIGMAVLTGNLDYQTSQVNSSSSRSGMFFGIQPKAKLAFYIHKKISFVFNLDYILTSINLDDGAADIGPAFGVGFRYNPGL